VAEGIADRIYVQLFLAFRGILSTVLMEVARNLLAKQAESGTLLSEWDVVIALFDGEEKGLLGSQMFINLRHPWMPEVCLAQVVTCIPG
jgi:hypothetical protein